MSTSRTTPLLFEIERGERIPLSKLVYFRQRFRDNLYDLVLSQFLEQEKRGLTKAEVARRIGRKPEQVTRWLSAPGNWTSDTASDLLLGISKSEPIVTLSSLENRVMRNDNSPHWLWSQNYSFQSNQSSTSTSVKTLKSVTISSTLNYRVEVAANSSIELVEP
jgi:hypothetical protein